MKKLIMLLTAYSISLTPSFAQGTWTSRDTLPDSAMVQGISGFSIENYGYAGLGNYRGASHVFDELWRFNPSTNSWAKSASFPGMARVAPACFVICDKAYLITGSVKNGGTCVTECWEYDATNNAWTQKANFPGAARTYAVGFAISGKGYVGTGANELSDFRKDFYRYNPDSNTWTRIADFGGIARSCASGFAVNGKGYVCFGQDSLLTNSKKWLNTDMWEYNPGTNSWIQKNSYPGIPIFCTSGFSICDNIYVGTGEDTLGFTNAFWKYSTVSDSWTQETKVPGVSKLQGAAFSIGDTGYYGFGCDSNVITQNKFYSFFAGDTCKAIDSCSTNEGYKAIMGIPKLKIYPNPVNQKLTIKPIGQEIGFATLTIMDITGREVLLFKGTLYHPFQINVSSLSSGIYILTIQTKDIRINQKFIKE